MKNDKDREDNRISFCHLMGFLTIFFIIFGIPAFIVSFLFKLIDPLISIILFLVSLLSIPLYSILVLIGSSQGKSTSGYLLNCIISYGSCYGIFFGAILAIQRATNVEKIFFVLISFIWGTISGIITAFIINKATFYKNIS